MLLIAQPPLFANNLPAARMYNLLLIHVFPMIFTIWQSIVDYLQPQDSQESEEGTPTFPTSIRMNIIKVVRYRAFLRDFAERSDGF